MTRSGWSTRGWAGDAMAVAVIGAVSFAVGVYAVSSFRSEGGVQNFSQFEFGPAVLAACGHGYRNPLVERLPALDTFLKLKTDRFDCASLPASVPTTPGFGPFQRTSRYLETSVALVWRVIGLSWSGLVVYGGLLYGAVICLVFAIFRLTLSRTWAALTTVPLIVSTMNLTILPQFRDYAKAPFILAMILVMGWLVLVRGRVSATIALAALGGVVAGIGLGFRNDLLITIPPFLIVLLFLTPWDLPRLWQTRAVAVAAFSAAFVVVSWPVIGDYAEGSNTGHVVLLGLMDPFDGPLGIERSIYSFGAQYDDSLAYTIIDSYAERVQHRAGGVRLGTREYDVAAGGYLGEIARHFPADLAVRTFAAAREVPRFFFREYQYPPSWARSGILRQLYRLRAAVETRAYRALPLLTLVAVLLVAARSPRAALFVVLVLVTFAGGSAIQFNERHFFHLEFLGWWAAAMVVQFAIRAARSRQSIEWGAGALKACAFALAGVATAVVILFVSRRYQDAQVRGLLLEYLAASTTPSQVLSAQTADGRVRLLPAPRYVTTVDDQALETSYLSATFSADRCNAPAVPLTLRYQGAPLNDLSRTVRIQLGEHGGEASHLLFPVYHRGSNIHFLGIEIDERFRDCVSGIAEFDQPSAFPLLLDVAVAPGWDGRPLHQTLRSWW